MITYYTAEVFMGFHKAYIIIDGSIGKTDIDKGLIVNGSILKTDTSVNLTDKFFVIFAKHIEL